MTNSVKKEKKQFAIDAVIVVVIAIAVLTVFWVLSSSKQTTTYSEAEVDASDALVCKNNTDDGSFFKTSERISVSHEIRILVKKDALSTITLIYTGQFESKSATEYASGVLHADYNKHLSEYGLSPSEFAPRFNTEDNTLTITLYANVGAINSVSSKLFYIDSSEFNKVKSMDVDKLKSLYESKGFLCTIQE